MGNKRMNFNKLHIKYMYDSKIINTKKGLINNCFVVPNNFPLKYRLVER